MLLRWPCLYHILFYFLYRLSTLEENLKNESDMTAKLQKHNHELVKNLESTTKVKDDLEKKLR
jgi:hypothetical protein